MNDVEGMEDKEERESVVFDVEIITKRYSDKEKRDDEKNDVGSMEDKEERESDVFEVESITKCRKKKGKIEFWGSTIRTALGSL